MRNVADDIRSLAAERILVLDGSWGVLLQSRGLSEADFRGERFASHSRDVKNDPDLLNLTRPDIVREVHDAYFAAGADIATTNTFTATSIGQADYGLEDAVYDMNVDGRAHRTRGGRPRPLRRRLGRSAERHAVAQPARRRPVVSHAHVRPDRRELRRADPRPARRRRRPAADRDDLRHAEREGGDRRRARRGAGAAALDQRHDRRPLRAHAVGADDRRLLDVDRARRPADRRRQLLARRARDASVRGGAVADRKLPDVGASERGAAERVRRLRRDARRHVRAPARVLARRAAEHRRLVLRLDARAHAGHFGDDPGTVPAAGPAETARPALQPASSRSRSRRTRASSWSASART